MDIRTQDEAAQIDRVLQSGAFREADSLTKLLRFLFAHSDSSVKEYQIATEVFGRPSDWDPRLDSGVRVQVGRLRSKLMEYASGEGAHDRLIVEIPKGSYRVSFVYRERQELSEALALPQLSSFPEQQVVRAPERIHRSPKLVANSWKVVALVFGVVLMIAGAVWFVRSYTVTSTRPAIPKGTQASGEASRAFWKPFTDSNDETWVIFSNAIFAGRPDTSLHYYHPNVDAPQTVLDLYTGVGEVLAIHELDRLFDGIGKPVRVKRGALLSLDDVKGKNLIFVGAPVENPSLNDIHLPGEFKFQAVEKGLRRGELEIVNVHPRPEEAPFFMKESQIPLVDDYALVALFHHTDPQHWVMAAAGTSTLGTQAAIEFLCSDNTVTSLMQRLGSTGAIHPFLAVLHVKLARGVPTDSQIVAFRLLP